jgi:hypothetical protein
MIGTMTRDKRYGRLRVLSASKRARATGGHKYYICVCDCGKQLEVRGTHLRQGRTTSCGCSRIGARAGLERYRAHCATEARQREALSAAGSALVSSRWSKSGADRDQPREAGKLGGRGIKEVPPPILCLKCGVSVPAAVMPAHKCEKHRFCPVCKLLESKYRPIGPETFGPLCGCSWQNWNAGYDEGLKDGLEQAATNATATT